MQQLFSQLGIDWPLLISQAVNFLILLIVLRLFVYKPLLKMMHDRKHRIEEGIMKAQAADERLHEIDMVGKDKIREAETKALALIKKTEDDAKRKEAAELANAQVLLRAQEEESRRAVERDAAAFVRRALVKAVELSPEHIDEALIARAVKSAATSPEVHAGGTAQPA